MVTEDVVPTTPEEPVDEKLCFGWAWRRGRCKP